MNPIFEQMIYYGIVVVLAFFLMGFLMRGFMWKYIRVRLSFGRLVLVRVISLPSDYFEVGRIEEDMLVFKRVFTHRISIIDSTYLMRAIGITWAYVDGRTWGILNPNLQGVDGYDPEKWEHLLTRALFRPSITGQREKIIIILLVVVIIGLLAMAMFVYHRTDKIIELVNVPSQVIA